MENIKNSQIIEAEKKRFQEILEYTTLYRGSMVEADENADETQQGEQDLPVDGAIAQGEVGDSANPQNQQDDNAMDIPDNGLEVQPTNAANDDAEEIGSDDEVVDITALVDAQDETDEKISHVSNKFDAVFKHISEFEKLLKSNNEKIAQLQSELEKRNPTPEEKLSLRALQSYPFNISPADYWKEKEATSNYRISDDDNDGKEKQYTITSKDLGTMDWKSISDSLDNSQLYNQTLSSTMPQ